MGSLYLICNPGVYPRVTSLREAGERHIGVDGTIQRYATHLGPKT